MYPDRARSQALRAAPPSVRPARVVSARLVWAGPAPHAPTRGRWSAFDAGALRANPSESCSSSGCHIDCTGT
eukprot:3346434-Pleurochrysis_carterae.AAC.1